MFLKGRQQQFIFNKEDLEVLFNKIFCSEFILFKSIAATEKGKKAINSINELNDLLNNNINITQLFIVPHTNKRNVFWEKINLNTGKIRYDFRSTYSQAIQLLLPKENDKRISVGRISVCTSWKDDETKEVHHATYGIEVYDQIKKIINTLSKGRLGVIYIGENAYARALSGEKILAYDLHNPDIYDFNLIKVKRKGN